MAEWIPVVYKPLSIMEIPETVFNEDSTVGDLLTGSFWALPLPPGLNQAGFSSGSVSGTPWINSQGSH